MKRYILIVIALLLVACDPPPETAKSVLATERAAVDKKLGAISAVREQWDAREKDVSPGFTLPDGQKIELGTNAAVVAYTALGDLAAADTTTPTPLTLESDFSVVSVARLAKTGDASWAAGPLQANLAHQHIDRLKGYRYIFIGDVTRVKEPTSSGVSFEPGEIEARVYLHDLEDKKWRGYVDVKVVDNARSTLVTERAKIDTQAAEAIKSLKKNLTQGLAAGVRKAIESGQPKYLHTLESK